MGGQEVLSQGLVSSGIQKALLWGTNTCVSALGWLWLPLRRSLLGPGWSLGCYLGTLSTGEGVVNLYIGSPLPTDPISWCLHLVELNLEACGGVLLQRPVGMLSCDSRPLCGVDSVQCHHRSFSYFQRF